MKGFIKSRDRDAVRRVEPEDRHRGANGRDRGGEARLDADRDSGRDSSRDTGRSGAGAPPQRPRRSMSGAAAVRDARAHLSELTGKEPEAVSSLTRTRDGWRVVLEIVELERIPQSTDILASYAVDLDGDGDLVAYQRVGRYYRSDVGGDR
jgi:hypothetical protein